MLDNITYSASGATFNIKSTSTSGFSGGFLQVTNNAGVQGIFGVEQSTYGGYLSANANDLLVYRKNTGTVGKITLQNENGGIAFNASGQTAGLTTSGVFQVGTTNSTYKFEVGGAARLSGTGQLLFLDGTNPYFKYANSTFGAFQSTTGLFTTGDDVWNGGGPNIGIASAVVNSTFYLAVNNHTTADIRTIANGNVGIGLNSPQAKLDVNGGISLQTLSSTPAPSSGTAIMWFDGTNIKITKNVGGTTTTAVVY